MNVFYEIIIKRELVSKTRTQKALRPSCKLSETVKNDLKMLYTVHLDLK